MGVIEAIKKGFGAASKNLGLIVILFVFNLVFNLASLPFAGPAQTAKPELAAVAVVFSLIFILISIFIQGGSLALVKDFVKQGKMKLPEFVKNGMKYYVRLLGLGAVIVLLIVIIGLVAALIVMATTPLKNTVVTIIAAIISVAIGGFGLYYVLLLILSPYIIVCDEVGIVEAMKKSVKTVRRSIGRVLLLLVMLILISLGLGFVIGFVAGLITVALPVTVGQVIIGLVNSIFNSYLGIVMMAAFMVFYLALTEKEKTSAQKVF